MLAGFDDCLITLETGENLSVLCVMDFAGTEQAEESFKHHEFTRERLERFKEKAEQDGSFDALANDASLRFMLAFEARRSVDLVIYSAEFESEWLAGLGALKPPEDEEEEQ
jgi:hypothetical protein